MQTTYLIHHGIKGQKWGVRRYQNEDGTLTPEGEQKYGTVENLNKRKKIGTGVAIGTGVVVGVGTLALGSYALSKLANTGVFSKTLEKMMFYSGDIKGTINAVASTGVATAYVASAAAAALSAIGVKKIVMAPKSKRKEI